MDLILALLLIAAALIVGLAIGFLVERGQLAEREKALRGNVAHWANIEADYAYLKQQIEGPPRPKHQHVYGRKPDPGHTKMGWMRFTCQYPGCSYIRWEPTREPART